MNKKILAAITALMMTVSVASCGKSEESEDKTDTTTTTTASAAATTKKASDSSSGEKTTKKTKKKTDSSSDDSSKTTKKTKKTTAEVPEDIEAIEGEFDENNELGWTKAIYDKYIKYGDDSKGFLMSLTLDEFLIVVSAPEDQARAQYNALHGNTGTKKTTAKTSAAVTTAPPETTTAAPDPGSTVDMTEDIDLQYTYKKFGVTLDDLLAITGYTREEFFYLWNEKKDKKFRSSIMNQLYGYNSYDSQGIDHPATTDKVDMRLVKAFWDDSGNLHIVCSINSGFTGIACDIQVPMIEITSKKDATIAKKDFGYITQPVDTETEEGVIEGIQFNTPVLHEFVFERSCIKYVYADIRSTSGVMINYKLSNTVIDTGDQMVP